jgi:outer membrane protein assembly factor BamB
MRTVLKVGAIGIGLAITAGAAAFGWRLSGSVSERHGSASGTSLPAIPPGPADWPCWRGPHGNNVSDDPAPPLKWSATENVRWRVPVPGRGHASPIVWGNQIFIATADEAEGTQSLICYDRTDGHQVWASEIHRGGLMAKHEKNSHASATPICDGRRVYANFARAGAIWVSAIDMIDGRIVWQTEAGPFATDWGHGSSPVMCGDLVIVAGDSRRSKLGRLQAIAFIAGLDRETGAIVWRYPRPEEHSFGTPIVAQVAGKTQLLLSGAQSINSYDPATGREIWHFNWDAPRTANTMAFTDALVFATTTQPGSQTVAIRADGVGALSDDHVAWRSNKFSSDVPSPLVHGGRLYIPADAGLVTCVTADQGKVIWKERLGSPISSSPVWAAGRIYLAGEDGTTTVFAADGPYKVLAKNPLGQDVLTTPVFSGGEVIIRSVQSLWCIGAPR